MGRSIFCSTCKKEKEPGRDNESRCKACKSQANIEKRAKKRAEAGLEPYGSGRSLYCCDCKAVKERRDYGYCNACRRKRDNENRLAKGVTKKHQTGRCPCGEERASYSKSYCVTCLARISKIRRERIPLTREQKDKICARMKLRNELQLLKHAARNLVGLHIRTGRLIPKPCEICGTDLQIEAHHDDYDKPLDVRWLCRHHHREYHKTLRGQNHVSR
jgi:hypothetical protein